MKNLTARRSQKESNLWEFIVEVAVHISDNEMAQFEKMEVKWIIDGMSDNLIKELV